MRRVDQGLDQLTCSLERQLLQERPGCNLAALRGRVQQDLAVKGYALVPQLLSRPDVQTLRMVGASCGHLQLF